MMPRRLSWIWLLALVCVLALGGLAVPQPSAAQSENLLNDPGFESTAVWKNVITADDNSASFNVAPAWNGWLTQQPRTQDWQNRIPNGFPHSKEYEGDPFVRENGNRSQNIGRGGATFTAAVYQTVSVPEGSNVIGSAYVVMNIPEGANSQARVGIDPNGGNTPFDSDIVWSPWGVNYIGYMRQLTVSATATGPQVTLWLYATQTTPTDPNGVYWDEASLVIGGGGGSAGGDDAGDGEPANTPVPTAPPFVPPVAAQATQEDGGIIHVVRQGDTVDSIAVAYGVTRQQILELNDIGNGRFIFVGQELVIRLPGGSSAGDDDDDDGDTGGGEGDTGGDEDESTATPRAVADAGDTGADDDADEPADEEPGGEANNPTAAEPDEDEDPDPTATDRPQPTATTPPPAPAVGGEDDDPELEPVATTTAVCVLMFEDVDANRIRNEGDAPLSGGTITLSGEAGEIGTTVTTGSDEPFCFDELSAGSYSVLSTAPAGYALTTADQLTLQLRTGDRVEINIGAAQGAEVAMRPTPDSGELAEVEVEPDGGAEEDDDQMLQNIGLIVFALAGLTLVGGTIAVLLLRRS